MKKQLIIIAAAFLVLSSCGGGDTKKEGSKTPKVESRDMNGLKIAFYDQDSVAAKFDFYVNTQEELGNKRAALENKIAVQQKAYQDAAMALQRGLQANSLSQVQIEGYQRKMQRSEEEVYRIQQTDGGKLESESMNANEVLIGKIEQYAKEFSEENGIDVLLSKAKGGQIAYISGSFDVSSEFIDYMNKKEKEIESEIED